MRYLTEGDEYEDAVVGLMFAADQAKMALCHRDKCGAVIYNGTAIVGLGYNAPPGDDEANRKCMNEYAPTQKLKSDRTCCLHAEWRAILHSLERSMRDLLKGSTLHFSRVDEKGNMLKSGQPYCTVCSRLILDCEIAHIVLWHEEGIAIYDAQEYNDISYKNAEA